MKPKTKRRKPVTEHAAPLKDTQKLISSYHSLNKRLSAAKKAQNTGETIKIQEQLEQMGGLQTYQRASLKGGDLQKGFGASGTWLINQLSTIRDSLKVISAEVAGPGEEMENEVPIKRRPPSMKLLDVGAITGEVYSKHKFLDVTSIDLNSQSSSVIKQDFFDRPIPPPAEKFDIVCLSLVINFLGDCAKRGEMLQRYDECLT
jgi:25S rRNA (adenine2142-N1)-methyltransferase